MGEINRYFEGYNLPVGSVVTLNWEYIPTPTHRKEARPEKRMEQKRLQREARRKRTR